jgi:peptidoglycan/LPS O-acetylase OafA/YrhL
MGALFGSLYFNAGGMAGIKKWFPPWSTLILLPVLIYFIARQPHGYLTLIPVLYAFLITATLVNAYHWSYRWMEWAPLTFIGRISYSIYIWQQIFTLGDDSISKASFLLTPPLSLLWIIPVSWFSFRYVETPGIRCGQLLIKRTNNNVPQKTSLLISGEA